MAARSADSNSARSYASHRRRKKGDPEPEPKIPVARTERPVDTASTEEAAVLIRVGPEAPPADGQLPMLDELAELTRTAGARVVARLYQRAEHPHAGSYFGKGKLQELKQLCEATNANLVVADTDLSPAQVRHMEEQLLLRVVDRSELIIDIFAIHARTQQARLQVELAQLQYQAPRLKRMWTHLSRITGAGGIGSRGPGEKQIEVDRRIVRRSIQDLRERLAGIEARRERQARRPGAYAVALVGYTNVGKSTLMRALTGADVYIADQLFATLDTRTRKWDLGSALHVLLSDTVGFIRNLPHHLVASFHATLEEVREADLLLHVVDAGDPDVSERIEVVRDVLNQIGASAVPEVLVLNKIDLVSDAVELTILERRLGARLRVSAASGEGLEELRNLVRERASSVLRTVNLRVPAADGKTLAFLSRVGRILSSRYDEQDICHISATVPPGSLSELEPFLDSTDAAGLVEPLSPGALGDVSPEDAERG